MNKQKDLLEAAKGVLIFQGFFMDSMPMIMAYRRLEAAVKQAEEEIDDLPR